MSTLSPEPIPLSPGAVFAAAVKKDGTKARATFNTTITEDFPGFKRRPRVAVRALFKVKTADKPQARYWYETHPTTAPGANVQDVTLRPEAAFEFHFDQQPMRPTTGWIQVPPNLLDDPEALAQFIDFRLLVRLCTAENQALTIGKGGERVRGIVETPGVTRLPARKDPVSSLLAACAEVEQMGGSADGILINSVDYYQYLLGQNGLLGELTAMGIRICRTRMVTQGTVVVGDFTAGATIYDSGRSEIRFAEPPPGIFPREGLAVCGEIYEALAVHLPTHFFVASLRP